MKQFITALAICAVLAAVGTALAAAGTAYAAIHVWNDDDRDSYWSTDANWVSDQAPHAADDVKILVRNYPVLTADVDYITNLTMGLGTFANPVGVNLGIYDLDVNGQFLVDDDAAGTDQLSYVELLGTTGTLTCESFKIQADANYPSTIIVTGGSIVTGA